MKLIFILEILQHPMSPDLILIGITPRFCLLLTSPIPVKSHAFSVRVTLKGIKSRSHAHPHYSHTNTKIDKLENFSKDNKTA